MELFGSVGEFLSNAKALLGIGAAVTIMSSTGVVPKVGVGRAFVLAWSPVFSSLPTRCIRNFDIKKLQNTLDSLAGGSYMVVTGGKGFGKSCMIQTALHRRLGVINVGVSVWGAKHPYKFVCCFL
jgi:hypothetical protein